MDVAITGSSGFIGTALVADLRARGHGVIRVTRDRKADAQRAYWSPTTGEIEAGAFEGLDAVIHLAGAGIADHRWNASTKRTIAESRTQSTTLLSTTLASLQRPPGILLSGSAIGIYGDRPGEVLDEGSARGSGFLADVCVAWEEATRPASDAGIQVTHLRTGIVCDPAGGTLRRMLPLFRLALGGRLGNGRQVWSWITLGDHLGAMNFLLDNHLDGPVNLTAPQPATNRSFTAALAHAVRRPAIFPVPRAAPRMLLGRELADNLLFSSADVRPTRLLGAGFEFAQPTLEQALEVLVANGNRPRPVTA
jgi:uncharacterized protein